MNIISNWPWLAAAGAALLVILLAVILRRRATRGRRELARAFRAVSTESASGILVPDGMGGEIWIDHLLLTARGLLVLDVKDVSGVIFGSDRMDEWAVIDGERRYTFRNPQSALYDRVAALKAIARDVPVSGRVAFTSRGRFTKGVPSAVIMLDALESEFGAPAGEAERVTEAFHPQWRRVIEASSRGAGRGSAPDRA